jgi:hypothetical protein
VVAGACALLLASAALGEPPRVDSPAVPPEGVRDVTLRELWRLGPASADADAPELVGGAFLDASGRVCLLDPARGELRVHGDDGRLAQRIEPGEGIEAVFRSASGACLLPRGGYALLQAFPAALLLFNSAAAPAGTVAPRMPDLPPRDSARVALSLVSARATRAGLVLDALLEISVPRESRLHRTHVLGLFDMGGRLRRRRLTEEEDLDVGQDLRIDERTAVRFQGRWTTGADGRIYAARALQGYEIQVYDAAGEPQRVIARDYESLPRTPEELAWTEGLFLAFARNVPRAVVTIEPAHADIQDIVAAPDSTLRVLTSRGRYRAPAGVLGVYDVFDAAGRFVRQEALRAEGDPVRDGVWLLGDRVVVARNLVPAARARLEGRTAAEGSGVVVVCYAR